VNLIIRIDKRRSCSGLDPVEAARSLQQLSSSVPCYYCPPVNHHHCTPSNVGRVHRRTMSASIEMPYSSVSYYHHPPSQQPPRRARAHTTSGYPPTMLFEPPSMYLQQEAKKDQPSHHRYHCHHCRKSFSRPSSLRIHIYSHTGEKPFKCHHQGCGRSFSVHSNMRRHLRVHYYPPHHHQPPVQHSSMRLPIVPTEQEEYQQKQRIAVLQ
jgi:uncharacterized Zn-finger protein